MPVPAPSTSWLNGPRRWVAVVSIDTTDALRWSITAATSIAPEAGDTADTSTTGVAAPPDAASPPASRPAAAPPVTDATTVATASSTPRRRSGAVGVTTPGAVGTGGGSVVETPGATRGGYGGLDR